MISYLLATNKTLDILQPTLESIRRLPAHEYEIVVCATNNIFGSTQHTDVKLVIDDKNDGSTYAFNLGSTHCAGEWIVVGTDEHLLNYDVLRFLDVIHSPQMQQQEYQIFNLGSPWSDNLRKQIISFPPIDTTNVPEKIQNYTYPVITLPAVSRKTINTKFDGMIFNPHLLHHFVDHWIGCYMTFKQPNTNLHIMGNVNAWVSFRSTSPNPKWDNHDANTFVNLAAIMIQQQREVSYTSDI